MNLKDEPTSCSQAPLSQVQVTANYSALFLLNLTNLSYTLPFLEAVTYSPLSIPDTLLSVCDGISDVLFSWKSP